MISADLHLHSQWSPDGQECMSHIFSECVKKNFTHIAITDHLDLQDPSGEEGVKGLERYLADIEYTGRNFPTLKILKGLEAGVNKNNLHGTEALIVPHRFDMILLSIHSFGSINVAKLPVNMDHPSFIKAYLEETLFCVSHMEQYQVLAHLDYPARYTPFTLQDYMENADLVEEVLIALIKRRKALELNTARLDRPENFRIMEWILQQYTRLGGYMVTVGSDAHKLEAIGRNFDRAEQLLNSVGLDHLTVFEDTRPKQLSWTSYSVELREPKS